MGFEPRQWAGQPTSRESALLGRARPSDLRREARRPALPAEIEFLLGRGVAIEILLDAAAEARRSGVSADRALLAEGFAPETFYRLLADHLGVPFIDGPLTISLPPGLPTEGLKRGIAPLAPNRLRLAYLMAPQGQALGLLLREMGAAGSGRRSFGIATPDHFETLVRAQADPCIAQHASHGLRGQDETLSAERQLTFAQLGIGAVVLAALGAGLLCYPAPTILVGEILFSLLFFSSVVLTLVATSMNVGSVPLPDRPVVDPDLPTYTVMVALYREAGIVEQLVSAMDRLDYPGLM